MARLSVDTTHPDGVRVCVRPCLTAGWGTYLSFGLPATIQLCTEWWMYEVVIFMAGDLGLTHQHSTQHTARRSTVCLELPVLRV
jgi:hypothetical protein